MARQYLDFDLAVEPSGDDRYVARVLRSPAGEAEAPFEWPFSPQDLEIFVLRIGHTRRGTRRSDSPEMGYAREFGRTLYDTVFQGAARTALIRSIDEAERRDAGLRIRLHLGSSPRLNDVPWEYLYSDDLNRFLIVSAETPIVRYVDLQRRVRPVTVSLPLHILAVVSAPTDQTELDVEGEWDRLQQALARLVDQGAVTLERLETPTLEKLQERLRRDQFHVLHFIGHGAFDPRTDEGVLYFTNDRGGSHAVTGEDLGTVLHDHRALRLVILNSCEGARSDPADPFSGSAQALVGQGIPAVIAMQFEITDKAALTISKNFYGSLADGYAVDAALAEARKAIFSQGNDVEWGTPVLYMRAPDGQLFDIEKTAEAAPRPAEPESMTGALYRQARASARQQDWSAAISQLEQVIDSDPQHSEAQAMLERARRQQLAANLYRGAGFLAAAEQWDAVLERFRDIDALDVTVEDPDGLRQKALEAIETRRQTEWLNEQLEQARTALADSDWILAKESAEGVLAQHPEHDEARRIAVEATDRIAVRELYELAGAAAAEERWDQVLKRFEEIEAIGVTYLDDREGLRARAVAGQAEQARLRDLDSRYEGAIALIEAQQWDQALSIIDALVGDQPGYRGVDQLRERVAAELEDEQRSESVAAAERRYVDALRSAASDDWAAVTVALDAIDRLVPDFGDPENLRARARVAKATATEDVEVDEVLRPEPKTSEEVADEEAIAPEAVQAAPEVLPGTVEGVAGMPPSPPPRLTEAEPAEGAETGRQPAERSWKLPAWLPGALIVVAADLPWNLEWWARWPKDLPLGFPLGLRETSLFGLNVRLLLIVLGTLVALQPYGYPGRPKLRRWAAAAALGTVVGLALNTIFSEEVSFGPYAASVGPWVALLAGLVAVRPNLPEFFRPAPSDGPLSAGAGSVASIVGALLIVTSAFLPWWGGEVTAFGIDFQSGPAWDGKGGALGVALVGMGVVILIAAVVSFVRNRRPVSWISLLGVAVFVYAASFQLFSVLNPELSSPNHVAVGVWVAALGGISVAIGRRLGVRSSSVLWLLFLVGLLVWSQAGTLADGWWQTVSSAMESIVMGVVGAGASILVAAAVMTADARIRSLPWQASAKRAPLFLGFIGLAGALLFVWGEALLDEKGGYWGAITASVATILTLGGVALVWADRRPSTRPHPAPRSTTRRGKRTRSQPASPPVRASTAGAIGWMLLVTYGSHVVVDLIVFARLNIEDYWPSAVVAAALVGAITSAVWGVAYSIAALRKRQGIAPTRSAALRSVPFLPFKTGGIWVLAGLPLNAVIAFVPPIMAPEEDWTTYAWIGLHVGLILLFWSAVRRFERTPG